MSHNVRLAMERTRAQTLGARIVLAVLASHAGRPGTTVVWPKQATVARLAGISDRSVRNGLRELEGLGEISVVAHGQGRGATHYNLAILSPTFDTFEETINRKQASGLDEPETGTRGPVSENAKPETGCLETGTGLPIEEKEDISPSVPSDEMDGKDGVIAEKQNTPSPSRFPSKITDISNRAVAGRLGERARED